MPSLNELVGQTITALVPVFHTEIFQKFKLHGVEAGGVWVEHQETVNNILARVKVSASPKTPVFFLPYDQITFVLGSIDVPALCDDSLT
jgi:hypothetical protein